ncbi:MAG: hypothetical protein RL653_2344 [Pseudomonadota bacterium]
MKRSRPQSLLALVLAGLWVLLPLASALHDEDHAHRYCAEHGVVEEAGTGAVAAADVDAPGVSDADGAEAGAAHVSCAFEFLHGSGDGLEVPTGRGCALSWGPSAAVGLRASDGVRVLPVLARAPKSSPPAC